MTDTPHSQDVSPDSKGEADDDSLGIIKPPAAAIPEIKPTASHHHNSNKKHQWTKDPPMFWVTLAGVIAVAAYTSVAAWQGVLMRDQIGVANPPRIKIGDIAIWTKDGNYETPPKFKPNEQIMGQVYVVNDGNGDATIAGSICIIYWGGRKLPMQRPWNGKKEGNCKQGGGLTKDDGTIANDLKPGGFAHWEIESVIPGNYNGTTHLYVMGDVTFKDRFSQHNALFARRYDPAEHRFITVTDNPDYEGEE